MTVVVTEEPDSWTTLPGFGIYADLTPPELASGRRLKRIRRLMVLALIALVALVVLAFGYTRVLSHQAATEVAAEQTRGQQLQAETLQYSQVTVIQGTVAQVRTQLSQLMVSDVDVGPLLAAIQAKEPPAMAVNAETVTISGAAAAAVTGSGATSLDTAGVTQIGKITVAGTTSGLPDVAAFVTELQGTRGVTDVVPGTTQITAGKATFSVTMSVTDAVLTHRYNIAATPAPTAAAASTATAVAAVN